MMINVGETKTKAWLLQIKAMIQHKLQLSAYNTALNTSWLFYTIQYKTLYNTITLLKLQLSANIWPKDGCKVLIITQYKVI